MVSLYGCPGLCHTSHVLLPWTEACLQIDADGTRRHQIGSRSYLGTHRLHGYVWLGCGSIKSWTFWICMKDLLTHVEIDAWVPSLLMEPVSATIELVSRIGSSPRDTALVNCACLGSALNCTHWLGRSCSLHEMQRSAL